MSLSKEIEIKFLTSHYVDLVFIDATAEFRCYKCNRVMIQHYITNCGHRFCEQCKRVLGDGVKGRKCPECTKIITKIVDNDDLEFKKNVLFLKCFCPNKRRGCTRKDTLRNIADHFNKCGYLKESQHTIKKSFDKTEEFERLNSRHKTFDKSEDELHKQTWTTSHFQERSAHFKPTSVLQKENPRKTYNVLLLGETFVGKSMFINAFSNYLKFKDLKEARENPQEGPIPCNFSLSYIPGEEDGDPIQDFTPGLSPSKRCRSYEFPVEDYSVRFIDTPGILNAEGPDRDRLNLDGTMEFLGEYEELHAICIFLKADDDISALSFQYGLKQLFSQLHINARSNITFVLTHARGSLYRPGDILGPLKKILNQVKESPSHCEIPLNNNNTFCLDNDALWVLHASEKLMKVYNKNMRNFEESWVKSSSESQQLIKYIVCGEGGQGLTPHMVKEMVALNNSRKAIVQLSERILELSKSISLDLTENKSMEIEKDKLTRCMYKLALYVKQNAILVTNDSYEEHLKERIKTERSSFTYGLTNANSIIRLEEMIENYKIEKDILDKL